jgi:hypothetical protein
MCNYIFVEYAPNYGVCGLSKQVPIKARKVVAKASNTKKLMQQ